MRLFLKLSLISIIFISCTFSPVALEIKRGEESEEEKNYKQAAIHYSRAMKREDSDSKEALYAAKKLANLSLIHLDDIQKAKYALNYIILNSNSVEDKKTAIERYAKIEYEKERNYENAIVQFQRLLTIEKDPKKRTEMQYLVARSYFYMNRLYQAEQELEQILEKKEDKTNKKYIFKAMVMRANIYHAKKKYEKAANTYMEIIDRFPKLSLKEKVWLNLSVCYEDMKQFGDAIDLLSDIKSKVEEKDFIEKKIVRLKERLSQEPGAKGLRK